MFHNFLYSLSEQQRGALSVALGSILLFGALGKLGFLQDFLNLIMVVVGIFLLLWGLDKTKVWTKIKNLKK